MAYYIYMNRNEGAMCANEAVAMDTTSSQGEYKKIDLNVHLKFLNRTFWYYVYSSCFHIEKKTFC